MANQVNRKISVGAAGAGPEQASERGPYAPGVRKKQTLVEAVLRLLAREGMGSITHRAVAVEAGTSLRSTTYYFATKEDMIREAFRYFVTCSLERIDRIRDLASADKIDVATGARLIVDQVAAESEDPNTSWAAEFELVLGVSRDPALAPEYLDFQVKLEERVQLMMKELGSPHSARDARIVLGFLRGFELEQLTRPDRPLSKRALVADLTRLLKSLCAVG